MTDKQKIANLEAEILKLKETIERFQKQFEAICNGNHEWEHKTEIEVEYTDGKIVNRSLPIFYKRCKKCGIKVLN